MGSMEMMPDEAETFEAEALKTYWTGVSAAEVTESWKLEGQQLELEQQPPEMIWEELAEDDAVLRTRAEAWSGKMPWGSAVSGPPDDRQLRETVRWCEGVKHPKYGWVWAADTRLRDDEWWEENRARLEGELRQREARLTRQRDALIREEASREKEAVRLGRRVGHPTYPPVVRKTVSADEVNEVNEYTKRLRAQLAHEREEAMRWAEANRTVMPRVPRKPFCEGEK